MKYKIISNGMSWNDYSWKGVLSDRNIEFVPRLFRSILRILWDTDKTYFKKIFHNKLVYNLFWLPFIKHRLHLNDEPSVILIYDWTPLARSRYCITKLRNSKGHPLMVYIFTNIIKITAATQYNYCFSLKEDYDQVYAFDPEDAIKYGFHYSKLIYTPKQIGNSKFEYDIFYIGQAKNRYGELLSIYKKATSEGLKCKFFIVGVDDIKYESDGIVYNTRLNYEEVLDYMRRSRAIVDAIQADSYGLTIKTCEAVIHNRKLITTNPHVKDEPFFKENNILIYSGMESIKEFLRKPLIEYSENDRFEFSPYRLFAQIEENRPNNCGV